MDRIRSFVAGPRPGAFIDLPWIFLFLLVLFLMHVWLGVTTLVGIVIFAALTLYTERKVAANMGGIELLRLHRNKLLERNNLNAPTIKGLGMIPPVVREWRAAEHAY